MDRPSNLRQLEENVPAQRITRRDSVHLLRSRGPLSLTAGLVVMETKRYIGRREPAAAKPRRLGNPSEHWVLILVVMTLLAILMTVAILYEMSVRSDAMQRELFAKFSRASHSTHP